MRTLRAIPCIICALAFGVAAHAQPAALVITNLSLTGADSELTIQSPLGITNQIQYSTDLDPSNWVVLTNVLVVQSPYPFEDAGAALWDQRFYRVMAITPATPNGMVLIPAGSFQMGDAVDGDSTAPVHTVTITAGYYMDANLVSGALWTQVQGYAISNGYAFEDPGSFKAPSHPVESVTWYDVAKWCNARSEMEALTPVYYTDAGLTNVYRSGQVDPYADPAAGGYHLPTEAQWEMAARGGLVGQRFPWGSTISEGQANYFGCPTCRTNDLGPAGYNAGYAVEPKPYTSPVGSFPPNGYNLYDIAGNIFEWCQDWYSSTYYAPGQIDPQGPASGSLRLLRGGSWADFSGTAQCASRNRSVPFYADVTIGFRTARETE